MTQDVFFMFDVTSVFAALRTWQLTKFVVISVDGTRFKEFHTYFLKSDKFCQECVFRYVYLIRLTVQLTTMLTLVTFVGDAFNYCRTSRGPVFLLDHVSC